MVSLELKRVLISDSVDSCCKTILERNGVTVDVNTKLSKEELVSEIPKYDGLIVRSATKVSEDVIKAGKNLKIIGRAGTGVDNIDTVAASLHGVLVMNTPGGNTLSAAEHTCALISSLARHIPQASASTKEGKWERKQFMGNELFGKTLAIIGLGRIGREVALRMQSYGVKTIGYDPLVSPQDAAESNIEWMETEKIWPLADYITVHVPLIPPTKGMLNDKTIGMCKKGVYILNVARGGIIDEEALLRGLESGHVGGAGLDVFVTEPPTGSSADLVKHPKVIACPHLGASTEEAQRRVAQEIADQFVDGMNGKPLIGLVNVPFNLSEALNSKPLVTLGERLGKVARTLAGGTVTKAIVTTHGALQKSKGFLTASVSVGLLDQPGTNLINAVTLVKQAGIQVMVSYQHSRFPLAVSVHVIGNQGNVSVTGSIIGEGIPVLLKYGAVDFSGPVPLTGKLTLFSTKDCKPTHLLMEIIPSLQKASVAIDGF
ncbi:predicted protein, partial [Nematostella vectensis]